MDGVVQLLLVRFRDAVEHLLELFISNETALAVTGIILGIGIIFLALTYITKNMKILIAARIENSVNAALAKSGVVGMMVGDLGERVEPVDELAQDPEITDPNVRAPVTETPDEGIGCVEAPRGTLTHHYVTDERGILTNVNLIVGTTNNHASISMSIKKAAEGLIHKGVEVTEGVLNKIEMAFRAYDPCMACATHSLPGQMPLEVTIRRADGWLVDRLTKGITT